MFKTCNSVSHAEELQSMLQRGVSSLHAKARGLVAKFIVGEYDASQGAFLGRDRQPDLYYTNFGLSCAQALNLKSRIPLHPMMRYLAGQPLHALDFIHQGCWIKDVMQVLQLCRQWSSWSAYSPRLFKLKLMQQEVRRFLSQSAWYDQPAFLSDPYMIYLAINLLQDLNLPLNDDFRDKALQALDASRAADGRGYSKSPQNQGGSVCSTTVAAILSRRHLSGEIDEAALACLQELQEPVGGFAATAETPLPDMLSTAVALFTLNITGHLGAESRARAKQFLSDHWLPNGGFASVIDEEQSDCEYTFYGLLSLGSLAA